jgi:hypothetical protein
MPFDYTTWCLLTIVFVSAFGVIFIVNQMPKNLRNLIFGRNMESPALNILRIFFGISQVQMPDDNFPRIILSFFIYFCLIIRCGYQGVMFELITTDLHSKEPETVEDLIRNNFTIFNNVLQLSNESLDTLYDGMLR